MYVHLLGLCPPAGFMSTCWVYVWYVLAGCIPVKQARQVYQDLVKGHQCLALSTDLHLLYLATPLDLGTAVSPNWMVYFELVSLNY